MSPTSQDAKLARERMAAQPFAPADGPVEYHSIHALNYIAFYLGEIEKHLAKIASALEAGKATGSSVDLTL